MGFGFLRVSARKDEWRISGFLADCEFSECGLRILAIFLKGFMSATYLTLNKFCLKKTVVHMAVSLNKLQNSRTNEKELIKKLTIRISNLNCGWRIRILDPKI